MLIDSTYFKSGKLFIPNLRSNPSVTGNPPSDKPNIDNYIVRYEEELMIGALGVENYEALKTALEQDPTLVDPANEKWKDLLNGKAYPLNDGKMVKWNGLREVYGDLKTSLIADFVFYHYLIDDVQNYTTTGIQREKAKNAEEQSPNLKLTQVWREFIEKYQFGVGITPEIVRTRSGVYTDYYNAQFNANRSLYQFLLDNDNYGDYSFRVYENRNRFGV